MTKKLAKKTYKRKSTGRFRKYRKSYAVPGTLTQVPKSVFMPLPQQFRVAVYAISQLQHDPKTANWNNGFRIRQTVLAPRLQDATDVWNANGFAYPSYFNQLMRLYSRARVEKASFHVTVAPNNSTAYRVAGAIIPFVDNNRNNGADANDDFGRISALPNGKTYILGGNTGSGSVMTFDFFVDVNKFITSTQQASAVCESSYNAGGAFNAITFPDRESTQLMEAPELRIQFIAVQAPPNGSLVQSVTKATYYITFSAPHIGYAAG